MLYVSPTTCRQALKALGYVLRPASRSLRDAANNARARPNLIEIQPQPSVKDESGARTLRTRKHGQSSLPLPPLLDPAMIARKEKHHKAKPRRDSKKPTELQKELAANPYARALAGSVRQCSYTRIRLPSHFLLAFRGVIIDQSKTPDSSGKPRGQNKGIVKDRAIEFAYPRLAKNQHTVFRTQSYLVNRKDVLQALGRKGAWQELINRRMQEQAARQSGRSTRIEQSKAHWAFIPESVAQVQGALQEIAVHSLESFAERRKDLFVPLEEGSEPPTNAAFVVTDGDGIRTDSSIPAGVTTYDLRKLVGDRIATVWPDGLKASHSWAVLRHGDSVVLHHELARLQAFMEGDRVTRAATSESLSIRESLKP